MASNVLLDRKHIREYALWGGLAGMCYSVAVLVYLSLASYYYSAIVFIGSILFMFMVMIYVFRLTRRKPEHKSTWSMIFAGHMVVLTGIIVSVIMSTILCFVFIPGFMSGHSDQSFLAKSPEAANPHNFSTVMLLVITSTLVNFGVGGFMSIVIAYAAKVNQTQDRTPHLFNEPARRH